MEGTEERSSPILLEQKDLIQILMKSVQSELVSLSCLASSESSSSFCPKYHTRKYCHTILGIILIAFNLCTFEEQR